MTGSPLTHQPAPASRRPLAQRLRDMPRRRALLLGFFGSLIMAVTSHAVGAIRARGGILQSLNLTNLSFGHVSGILVIILWIGVLAFISSWVIIGGRILRLGESLGTRTLIIWIAPLLVAGPLMSRDVYSYLMQGTLSRDGFDPYSVGASAVPGRIFFEVSPDWRNTTTPYGPLHMWIGEGIVRLTGDNITAGVAAYKVFSLACFAVLVWTVARLARALGANPDFAVWLGVANPLSVIHLVGGMHNEVTMMALVCAGLLAGLRLSPVWGLLCGSLFIGAGISLKATAAIALPFLVWIFVARWAGALDRSPLTPGVAGVEKASDGSSLQFSPTRTPRQVLADLRLMTARRAATLVVSGVCASVTALVTVAAVTAASGQTWGWIGEISGNSKVINPLAVPSLIASALVRPIGMIDENIFFNDILAAVRPYSTVVMILALVGAWIVWRRSTHDALIGATVAYMATCLFNAVVLPWYYVAPLALVGLWVRDRRAIFAIAWLIMVLSMTFDGSGNNRLYNLVWVAAVGLLMWWLARACLRSADGHRLGTSHDFPGKVAVERIDRTSGQ